LRTIERFSSSKNSTRTWVTVPREPVRPSTSLTLANFGRESPSLSCIHNPNPVSADLGFSAAPHAAPRSTYAERSVPQPTPIRTSSGSCCCGHGTAASHAPPRHHLRGAHSVRQPSRRIAYTIRASRRSTAGSPPGLCPSVPAALRPGPAASPPRPPASTPPPRALPAQLVRARAAAPRPPSARERPDLHQRCGPHCRPVSLCSAARRTARRPLSTCPHWSPPLRRSFTRARAVLPCLFFSSLGWFSSIFPTNKREN